MIWDKIVLPQDYISIFHRLELGDFISINRHKIEGTNTHMAKRSTILWTSQKKPSTGVLVNNSFSAQPSSKTR